MTNMIRREEKAELTRFDDEQKHVLKNTLCRDVSVLEFELFLAHCSHTGLDPFRNQISCTKIRDKMVPLVRIDGLRVMAERTGDYQGQLGPFWCGRDGQWVEVWLDDQPPMATKVGILRKGWREPLWSVAKYSEYVQARNGRPSMRWAQAPAQMLAKCAEALGLRRAFPEQLSGSYAPEEVEALQDEPEASIGSGLKESDTRTSVGALLAKRREEQKGETAPPVVDEKPVEVTPEPLDAEFVEAEVVVASAEIRDEISALFEILLEKEGRQRKTRAWQMKHIKIALGQAPNVDAMSLDDARDLLVYLEKSIEEKKGD